MLDVRALSAGYGERSVLDRLDLRVERGELLAVVGPNGCGKTTLLRVVSGLLPIAAGEIELDAASIREIRAEAIARRVAVVPQSALMPARFRAFDIVMMGRTPHLRLLQWESRRDAAIARGAMQRTGCWDLRDRMVDELSGGERQRVILARALAQEPELLLLDEPTSHLDLQHQVETFALVRELCAERGLAAVAVVHDLMLAAMFADRVAMISRGRNVATGAPQDVLTAERIGDVYGVAVRVMTHPASGRPVIVPEPAVPVVREGVV